MVWHLATLRMLSAHRRHLATIPHKIVDFSGLGLDRLHSRTGIAHILLIYQGRFLIALGITSCAFLCLLNLLSFLLLRSDFVTLVLLVALDPRKIKRGHLPRSRLRASSLLPLFHPIGVFAADIRSPLFLVVGLGQLTF